jgi:hypothetical protein
VGFLESTTYKQYLKYCLKLIKERLNMKKGGVSSGSGSVDTHLGVFKGTRAGAKRKGAVDPGWGVFKGTRAGRNPDRPINGYVGCTMPARGK